MRSLGAEKSVELFPAATWASYDASQDAPAEYPGMRPTGSWALDPDGWLRGLDPVGGGWCDRETAEPIDLSGRCLVLAYGSNPDPGKLLKEPDFFGGQPVLALRAAVFGWAAVWCDARRGDGSVVATLGRVPGRVEVHPVLALTVHQLAAMDRWEGHPTCYQRAGFDAPVLLESGAWSEDLEVYLGTDQRRPWEDDGRLLVCADVPYARIDLLVAR